MANYTITPARPSDLPDIHTMIRALSAFHGDTAQVSLANLQDILFGDTSNTYVLVASSARGPLGYAAITQTMVIHEGKPSLNIHHLYVHETHRANGIGTALINAAKSHANRIGATRLTIGTDPRNATAIAAYRAMPLLTENTGAGARFRVDLTA